MAHGRTLLYAAILVFSVPAVGAACGTRDASPLDTALLESRADSLMQQLAVADTLAATSRADSVPSWQRAGAEMAEADSATRYATLTDADFRKVAEELGVEVAAIKAVVRIEAGARMEGFWAPGVPVINFDRSMYNKSRASRSVKAPASEKVPEGIKSSYGRKEWSQLVAARKVNLDKANMGTFWGMFQIGGFNYKLCGCESVQEFVDRMSYSEFEQLELFAQFIKNAGILPALRDKNWAAFARKYNGASYAKRRYHTRMAAEYAKFKKQEQQTQ